MSGEKELIKQRGSYKGRLTNFTNYLNTLKESSLDAFSASELQLRIGKMESLYDDFDEVQVKLETIDENIDSQLNERERFESQYFQQLAIAQNMLTEFSKADSSNASQKSSHVSNHKLVKLPTIQLPKFSGSYETWLEYRDTFSSLIHSNDEIDSINKFHYLRSSLEGTAAEVINSVEFSAKNYDIAWDLLCDRFDNKRLLIQHHVSTLFNLENVTKESSNILKRIIDHLNKNLRALRSLGEPIDHWDTLLIYIVTHKLDQKTFREWEEVKGRLNKDNPISLKSFIEFLKDRADLLETLETMRNGNNNKINSKIKTMVSVDSPNKNNTSQSPDSVSKTCPKCNGEHSLNNCPQFLALSNNARLQLLPSYKICFNCFKAGHYANHCKRGGCKICKRKHNTLVHVTDRKPKPTIDTAIDANTESNSTSNSSNTAGISLSASISSSSNCVQQSVLLSTALVKLYDDRNREHIARAVLDSGSTSCLMTENFCQRLKLPVRHVDKSILGINNVSSHIGKMCRVPMKSLSECYSTTLQCFFLPSITDNVPCQGIELSNLNIPTDICLADPHFYKPAVVDLIIGADVFWDLLGTQRLKLGDGKPILCETRLGWLVSGTIDSDHGSVLSQDILSNFTKISSNINSISDEEIQHQLTRFWQLEEINSQSTHFLPEEKLCEEHFKKHTTRLEDGRFCVRIPLKQNPDVLGDSLQRATQCLKSLERRASSKPKFNQMYTDFMSEYYHLGHMSEVRHKSERASYFIPHHDIVRECSSTTKLRVVFNASAPTTSGISFNDIQMIGPTVQDDLLSILLRFRQHTYILAADVEKMYRQILVHPSDRSLQQIVWRDDVANPVKLYQLNTVTYGTASAPYLATRCLKQVGLDSTDEEVAKIIIHDFYVDDLLTGGDDLVKVKELRRKITEELASACMPLRKWKSNEPQLISTPLQESFDLNIGSSEPSKLLGLGWHADSDELCFPIGTLIPNGNTKRDMLSVISQIFDPLGLLAPCVINMKMLLQKLWLEKLSWDEQLSPSMIKLWKDVIISLPSLSELRIPRRVVIDFYSNLELHIFSDASERAYGACIYVRSVNNVGEIMVRLLIAKSRVAPIKPTTIPRLELCGALVGARLYEKVTTSLRLNFTSATFWTDSTIVLGWLKMLPSRLQPFVRNRVADILERSGNHPWRHVPTNKNPADLVSRGVGADCMQSLNLWWNGPSFLSEDVTRWPPQSKQVAPLPETRPVVSLITCENDSEHFIKFDRFSNFSRVIRTTAYVLRFIHSCKRQPLTSNHLTNDELRNASSLVFKISQRESFPEYTVLLQGQVLPKKSQLLKFNAFLDENNVLRVGGRLSNSNFSYDKKYPILLQSTHYITKLLFKFEHLRLMHAGPQLLLASIRETYWPIGGRNLAKACYRQCVRCNRLKGKIITSLMGNLPLQRVQPGGYPFENVGVDYAGPILSASRQDRGCRLVKVYIAIFICFVTKAIHLELVGSLTSQSYILTLRRFIARRGKPVNIYSDNGSAFVGACNDLSKFLKTNCGSLSETVANEGISFHFNPAYAPHFGSLWEAGVKSTKHHLRRVLGNCHLTYEELNTTLTQIEAILNSRPLTPISSDPEDFLPLTPGHFLIGRPLTSLPERDMKDFSTNNLTRFQRIEQLRQHFWTRWSKEYVAELQQRTKWRSCKDSIKLDSLVVIKEEDLPPLKWKLGRIVAVHPGPDGIVRVADIKTSSGIIRRAFSKICPLPSSSG